MPWAGSRVIIRQDGGKDSLPLTQCQRRPVAMPPGRMRRKGLPLHFHVAREPGLFERPWCNEGRFHFLLRMGVFKPHRRMQNRFQGKSSHFVRAAGFR